VTVKRPRDAKILDFVGEVEAAMLSDRAQLRAVIVEALARMIPSDRVVCVEAESKSDRGVTIASDPEFQSFRRANLAVWAACLPHHPKLINWAKTGTGSAVRLSDLVSRRALLRLPIYNYFWRRFEVDYDLGIRLERAPEGRTDLSCTRSGKDFSEDERDSLEALRPYLFGILRRADATPITEALRHRYGISRREADVLALVARGKTNPEIAASLFLSAGTVRKHLEHVYTKLGVATRAQATASALNACLPAPPQDRLLSPDPYRLTKRESEVLAVLATGKSNSEIATTLAVAPETVKRHLDHIYTKLRVRRRSEATARALRLGLTRDP
jgi:DNA-binding CsgD family transcriptional regulator